jgi:putative membrane protein
MARVAAGAGSRHARRNHMRQILLLIVPLSEALHVPVTPIRAATTRQIPRVPRAVAQAPAQVPRLTDDGYSFDSESFQRYGGSSAWLFNLATTGNSRVLERVSGHLAATIAVAAFISIAFGAAQQGSLPPDLAAAVQACALPALPFEAIGSIIGLLLAFRTGQAYDRFWEARTLWDGVYASTRSIVRLATATSTSELSNGDDLETIVALTAAYPYSLKQHLRGERNPSELYEAAMAATGCERRSTAVRQLVAAAKQPNVPLAVLDGLSRTLIKLRATHGDLVWWQLDAKLEELISILGKAERIKGTPVPLSYSRHTSRFFSVYTFLLPLSLCTHMSLVLLPPTVAVISWVIFATEEIGHIIEEPFGRGLTDDPDLMTQRGAQGDGATSPVQLEVLPLGRYCADICSDAATIVLAAPATADAMPGGDDELDLFDANA